MGLSATFATVRLKPRASEDICTSADLSAVKLNTISSLARLDQQPKTTMPSMVSKRIQYPTIRDFKPFLGYGEEDYEAAKQFYGCIGFAKLWDGGDACCFDTGIGHRFLVTLHYGLDRSSAGMMHFWVESVDSWYDYLKPLQLDKQFAGVKIAEPTVAEWGWRILYVRDPGGWLLHIAEPHSEENKAFFNSAPWVEKSNS